MSTVLGRAHRHLVFNRRIRALVEHFSELIPENASVLDVGCGDGLFLKTLFDQRPDLAVKGLDVLIRDATHLPVEEFDGTNIPYPTGAFDAVLLVDVLHHTDHPLNLLREAKRVAARFIVIKDHIVTGFVSRRILTFMDYVGNAHHGVRLPYNYLSDRQWDALFSELQLSVVESREKLGLYAFPADLVFERSLHRIFKLEAEGSDSTDFRSRGQIPQ